MVNWLKMINKCGCENPEPFNQAIKGDPLNGDWGACKWCYHGIRFKKDKWIHGSDLKEGSLECLVTIKKEEELVNGDIDLSELHDCEKCRGKGFLKKRMR